MFKKLIWIGIIAAVLIVVIPKLISRLSLMLLSISPNPTTQDESTDLLLPPLFNPVPEATNSSRIIISGYANNASKVELFINNLKKDSVSVGEDGSFSFDTVILYNGQNQLYAVSYSDNGQASQKSKILTLLYSSESPKLDILTPEDNEEIKNDTKIVSVTGFTDKDNEIIINNRQVLVANDGSFMYQMKLIDGVNSIKITAKNPTGNISEVVRTVTYSP